MADDTNTASRHPASGPDNTSESVLWRREQLRELLERIASLAPAVAADAVWADQRQRWERGEAVAVDEYWEASGGRLGDELLLDLIYGEFQLRIESGEVATAEDYIKKYPGLAQGIRRQLVFESAVDSFLGTTDHGSTVASAGVGAGLSNQPSTTEPFSCPIAIGKYRIVAPLDAGTQGEVYRAVHPTLGRDVVVKLGRGEFTESDPRRERLLLEGRVLAELDHPGLARVYDLDFHGDRPYLVIEFVRGSNLDQYVRRSAVTACEAAKWVAQIARALTAAHQRGVLHLDVKPKNILLNDEGQPRLIDFGLARVEHAWSHPASDEGILSGTVPYMSPEQALGETSKLTPRSDVYSLGGVLFFLLTGRPPLEGQNLKELLQQATRGNWDRTALERSEVPTRLRRICERAMAFAPADRYAEADVMATDLERFASASGSSWRAHRGLLVIAAAGLLVAAAWPVSWLFSRSARRPVDGAAVAFDINGPALSIRVQREATDPRGFTELPQVAPLRTGDELKLRAMIPQGFHAAIVSYSNEQGVRLLNAMRASEPERTLRFPAGESQVVPLEGPSGTEVICLCVRRAAPVREEELRELWGPERDWPPLSGSTVLRIGPKVLQLAEPSRPLGMPRSRPDPEENVADRLLQLGKRLAQQFDYFEIVAFAHERP